MRKLALALAAASFAAAPALLTAPAFAQVATPMGPVRTMAVPPDAMISYNMIGLNVVDGANASVGEIKDLVIEKGALAGYILSVGGFLGMGERFVAVSPDSVHVAWDATAAKWKATVNATKDQLKNAPEFKYEGKFKRSMT